MPELEIEQFERFAELNAEKTDLSAKLKSVKDEMDALQEPLMEQLVNSGQSKVNLASGTLIFPKTDVFVKAGKAGESASEADWNRACDVLEELGLTEFSKRRFLIPTLKSYITKTLKAQADADGVEYDSLEELLPPELAAVISVDTATKLSAKKG